MRSTGIIQQSSRPCGPGDVNLTIVMNGSRKQRQVLKWTFAMEGEWIGWEQKGGCFGGKKEMCAMMVESNLAKK